MHLRDAARALTAPAAVPRRRDRAEAGERQSALRQADIARRARGLLARLRAAWRGN